MWTRGEGTVLVIPFQESCVPWFDCDHWTVVIGWSVTPKWLVLLCVKATLLAKRRCGPALPSRPSVLGPWLLSGLAEFEAAWNSAFVQQDWGLMMEDRVWTWACVELMPDGHGACVCVCVCVYMCVCMHACVCWKETLCTVACDWNQRMLRQSNLINCLSHFSVRCWTWRESGSRNKSHWAQSFPASIMMDKRLSVIMTVFCCHNGCWLTCLWLFYRYYIVRTCCKGLLQSVCKKTKTFVCWWHVLLHLCLFLFTGSFLSFIVAIILSTCTWVSFYIEIAGWGVGTNGCTFFSFCTLACVMVTEVGI